MISKTLLHKAQALLEKAGYLGSFELAPLIGGGNNRVFIVREPGKILGVLKEYYHHKGNQRDRLDSEWRFSKFLWNHNIRKIPEPIVSDPVNHIAFYSFVNGTRPIPEQITKEHIDQALNFYFSMNSFRHSDDSRMLSDAAEACFSFGDHVRLTDRRILNLKYISNRTNIEKKAHCFVNEELLPLWNSLYKNIYISARDNNIPLNTKLDFTERRLSPSDFGFHNTLVDDRGILFFMDFEYSGWDDPAKMVCDFFCQPAIPVSPRYFPSIAEKIANDSCDPAACRIKIELLLPIYRIKWCCIILNDFLPRGKFRRFFINNTGDSEMLLERQLEKAMDIVYNLSELQ